MRILLVEDDVILADRLVDCLASQRYVVDAIAAMQAVADQAQVTLVVESLPLRLWVDGDRMQQLLTNLLSNAIKFSPRGGTMWLLAQAKKSRWVGGWVLPIHPPMKSASANALG